MLFFRALFITVSTSSFVCNQVVILQQSTDIQTTCIISKFRQPYYEKQNSAPVFLQKDRNHIEDLSQILNSVKVFHFRRCVCFLINHYSLRTNLDMQVGTITQPRTAWFLHTVIAWVYNKRSGESACISVKVSRHISFDHLSCLSVCSDYIS